jgi:site-specific recombinase XerD
MILPHLIHDFSRYLTIQKQRSRHTVMAYVSDVTQFFEITHIREPSQLCDYHMEDYLMMLNKKKLTKASIHRKITALHQFWKYFLGDNSGVNPWDHIKRPKLSASLPLNLEEKNVLELLNNYPIDNAIDVRNKAILELLFSSGIRVGELIQIKSRHLYLNRQEVCVLGKGCKERWAMFGERAKVALENYLNNVRSTWCFSNSESLFISKRGHSITARTVQRLVKDANRYHSSKQTITPHSCRHTFASVLLSNGAGIRDIQELLGHSSISTTQRYAHIPTKKLAQRFLDTMNS